MTETTPRPALSALMTDRLGRVAVRSAQIIVIGIAAIAVIYGLVQVRLVVIPLLLALVLAAAFAPLVGWARRRGVPQLAAAWLVLVLALGLLAGVITLISFAVRRQWADLVDSASQGFDEMLDYLRTGPLPIGELIDDFDPDAIGEQVTAFVGSSQFGSGALAGVSIAGEVLAGFALLLVILFFFLKDGDRMWEFLLKPVAPSSRTRGRRLGRMTVTTLGGYVRGTAIVALVDAVVIGAALALLGVPLALPLAAIVFLAAFIPIVGATVAGILAALVALVANGPIIALIVVIVVVAVNQLEGDLLQPIVLSQAVKLHPLVILLALAVGTILGGVIGAILSVPIAAVAWGVIRSWNAPEPASERAVDAPPE